MQGVLQSTIHIGNDLRAISARARYPWDRAQGKTPLPADLRATLREEYGVGAWNVAGAIYGTSETVAAARKVLRRTLAEFDITFLDDRTLNAATRLQSLLNKVGLGQSLGERLEVVKPVNGQLKGVPSDEHLRGAGWRVRGPAPVDPTDPLDCHAGLLWIAPLLPANGASAVEVMRLVEPIFERHGFEPLVTFTLITDRALVCVSNLSFDRREPADAARAKACYDELTATLAREGYISYRTGPRAWPSSTKTPTSSGTSPPRSRGPSTPTASSASAATTPATPSAPLDRGTGYQPVSSIQGGMGVPPVIRRAGGSSHPPTNPPTP
jgi:4-cresol dehydrogenase (hydroxylating)